jgi:hypothetical protein
MNASGGGGRQAPAASSDLSQKAAKITKDLISLTIAGMTTTKILGSHPFAVKPGLIG